jgi:diguanylate cyclase (GGDEF)-like protein
LLDDRLTTALAHARRTEEPLAVVCLDVDDFKRVNDTHGHSVGDQLLIAVARRMQDTHCAAQTRSRAEGATSSFLSLSVQMQRKAWPPPGKSGVVYQACSVGGLAVRIGAGIGVANFPRHGRDAHELLKRADSAL